MITSLFKNNIFSYIFIPVFGATLWISSYYRLELPDFLSINIGIDSYEINTKQFYIITYFVAILFGYVLNSNVKKHLFSYEPTNLTYLFYVLFVSMSLSTSFFWEFFGTTLLVIIMQYIFIFNENKIIANSLFNSSFFTGVLIILNLQFILLIPFLLYSYSLVNSLSFKNISLVFIGSFLPFFYVIVFSFLANNIEVIPFIFDFDFSIPEFSFKILFLIILLLTLSVFGFKIILDKRSGTDAGSLRMVKIVFTLMVFMFLIALISVFSSSVKDFFVLISVPSSILVSGFLLNNSTLKKEILFVLIVLICIFVA